MKPSIAFFGSSLVSAHWNGAATYYRGVIRALADRGFSVTFYEPDACDRQQHRDIPDPEWATVVVYAANEQGVGKALEQAQAADVIVKASGVGVFDELLDRAVLDVKRPRRGIEMFLEPGSEVLVAADGASVAEQLDRLTLCRAMKIGSAARRRVLAHHTYAQRAAQVDELLDQGVVV